MYESDHYNGEMHSGVEGPIFDYFGEANRSPALTNPRAETKTSYPEHIFTCIYRDGSPYSKTCKIRSAHDRSISQKFSLTAIQTIKHVI